MAYLGNDLQVAFPTYRNIDDISGSFNGVTTSFPLTVAGVAPIPAPINSQQCLISVNGVVQRPDDSGTEGFRLSGGNIIFASAPAGGVDFFGVILAGADYVNIGANFPSGTAVAPSITFDSDLDTGIYNPAGNQIGFTTSGVQRLVINSSGQISGGLGTAAAPVISFISDPNTGIYSPGADQVAISTGGSGRLFVDASGNVGVGTNPASQLHVNGQDIYLTSNGTLDDNRIRFSKFNFTGNSVGAALGYTYGVANTQESGSLVFYTNPNSSGTGSLTERARIDSSGRLLVGTSSARSNFYNSTLTSLFQVESASGTRLTSFTYGEVGNSGPIHVFAKHRSASVGGVTIVAADDNLGTLSFQGSDGTEFVAGAEITAQVDGTPGANDMPGRLVFSTTADGASSPTERMRIDNTGGILFGRTVLGNIGDSLGIAFGGGAGYAYFERSGGPGIYVRRATSTGNAVEFYQGTNTYVGSISVTASATAYNTSSDYRLKENVKLVTDGINRLQQLKPSRFNFIADPDTVVDGFIAHEVQAVVPEAITGEKDAVDEDGNPVYQGIDQSKLVPLLTAALQEAIGEIESLKARVATLETA